MYLELIQVGKSHDLCKVANEYQLRTDLCGVLTACILIYVKDSIQRTKIPCQAMTHFQGYSFVLNVWGEA